MPVRSRSRCSRSMRYCPAFSLRPRSSSRVSVVTGGDDPAVSQHHRRGLDDGAQQQLMQGRVGADFTAQSPQQCRAGGLPQGAVQLRQPPQGVAQLGQVPRARGSSTLRGRGCAPCRRCRAGFHAGAQSCVSPAAHRCRPGVRAALVIPVGALQPAPQQAGAHGGGGAVQHAARVNSAPPDRLVVSSRLRWVAASSSIKSSRRSTRIPVMWGRALRWV